MAADTGGNATGASGAGSRQASFWNPKKGEKNEGQAIE
jgi:hypothetical protein